MEKLKMHSPDLTGQNIVKLMELFPNCVTESRNKKGDIERVIDFDVLRQELSDRIVEGPEERYHLNWPGKREAQHLANAPIAKTLRPCREESVDFDKTENIFIEGDNLDALKLLQDSYLGKVKMIYIDPPYNTGNDFIYEDDFAETTQEYLKRSNQKDEEGNKMMSNTESNGRYHSDWLSMMYPRLKLARNLLRDDGVIFISIDDNEVHNLKKICDQVFGENNFFADMVVVRSEGGGLAKRVVKGHDNLLIFCKSLSDFNGLFRPKDIRGQVIQKDGREYWIEEDWLRKEFGKYGTCLYEEIEEIKGKEKKEEIDLGIEKGKYTLIEKKNGHIVGRLRAVDEDGSKFYSIIKHLNKNGMEDLKALDLADYFNFPKPVSLIRELILGGSLFSKNDKDLILDFFAGSSSTAHAVLKQNAEDGGNRKFIMIQLPEPCNQKSEAYKAGYNNIAEISKERIRRVGKQIKQELASEEKNGVQKGLFDFKKKEKIIENFDVGFRVLKIASSNMEDVYYSPAELEQGQLKLINDNIKQERSEEDLLFQVLIDWGVDLSLPIKRENIMGLDVFFVDENSLLACFAKDGGLTEDFIKELAKYKPIRVVFRDAGFKSDDVKINVEQVFKLLSSDTQIKTI